MELLASLFIFHPLMLLVGIVFLLRTLMRMGSRSFSRETDTTYVSTHHKDVYHAAFLIRQKLPAELAPDILDFAEYWVKSSASCTYHLTITERDLRVGSRTSQELQGALYHTSPLIAGDYEDVSPLHPLRKVVFTINSKDQGWSSYPAHHGTYINSWTWFEAVVLDWADDAPTISPRRICTNVHAGTDFKTHVVTWTCDSDDEEERQWVRQVRRGSKIGINVWAQYPGWANSIHSANIDIYTAAIR